MDRFMYIYVFVFIVYCIDMNNSTHLSPSLLERVLVRSHTAYVRQEGVLLGAYIYMLAVGVPSRVHMGSPARARQLRVSSLGFTCNTACGRLSVRSCAHVWHMLAEEGVLPGAYTCSPLEGVLSRVHVGLVEHTMNTCMYLYIYV
jgi:hypothetical protein